MFRANLESEIDVRKDQPEGEGIDLNDLAAGAVLEIETQHHHYRLIKDADAHVRISGHPTFCPEPVEVEIEGSIQLGQPLKTNPHYIGRGMRLLLRHPRYDLITTSQIREVHRAR